MFLFCPTVLLRCLPSVPSFSSREGFGRPDPSSTPKSNVVYSRSFSAVNGFPLPRTKERRNTHSRRDSNPWPGCQKVTGTPTICRRIGSIWMLSLKNPKETYVLIAYANTEQTWPSEIEIYDEKVSYLSRREEARSSQVSTTSHHLKHDCR